MQLMIDIKNEARKLLDELNVSSQSSDKYSNRVYEQESFEHTFKERILLLKKKISLLETSISDVPGTI